MQQKNRAYGALDPELCTTSWVLPVNKWGILGVYFNYLWNISCVGQMQQKIQGIILWFFCCRDFHRYPAIIIIIIIIIIIVIIIITIVVVVVVSF